MRRMFGKTGVFRDGLNVWYAGSALHSGQKHTINPGVRIEGGFPPCPSSYPASRDLPQCS